VNKAGLLVLSLALGLPDTGQAGPAVHAVVYEGGDEDDAIDRVAWNAQVPEADLQPVPLDSLLDGGEARVLGGGTWHPCAEPSTRTLSEALAEARRAWMYARLDEVHAALEGLEDVLACGPESPTRETAWDALVLLGVARTAQEDTRGAYEAFLRAVLVDPGRPWDASYAPQHGEAGFDTAVAVARTEAPATLSLVPTADVVTLGGRPGALHQELPPGLHLVRVGDTGGWLDLGPGEQSVLVVPDPEVDLATWAEHRPEALARVLATDHGPMETVYLTATDAIWRGEVAAPSFQDLQVLPQPRSLVLRRSLLGGGAAIAVGGGAVAGVMTYKAWRAVRECDDARGSDPEVCEAYESPYDSALRVRPWAWSAAAVGTALGASGLFLELQAGRRGRVVLAANGPQVVATVTLDDHLSDGPL